MRPLNAYVHGSCQQRGPRRQRPSDAGSGAAGLLSTAHEHALRMRTGRTVPPEHRFVTACTMSHNALQYLQIELCQVTLRLSHASCGWSSTS